MTVQTDPNTDSLIRALRHFPVCVEALDDFNLALIDTRRSAMRRRIATLAPEHLDGESPGRWYMVEIDALADVGFVAKVVEEATR